MLDKIFKDESCDPLNLIAQWREDDEDDKNGPINQGPNGEFRPPPPPPEAIKVLDKIFDFVKYYIRQHLEDFKGNPGEDGKDGISATHEWEGTVLNMTSASGTSSADLKGDKGDRGDKGKDGISVTHKWDGTTLIITSASGTYSADLKGEKGDVGPARFG